jgi:hypothetical protein
MVVKLMPVAPAAPIETKSDQAPVEAKGPRKRRKANVYDAEGNEVLISLTCLKCRNVQPLSHFGLRKMADGAIRNQPWCRYCRGATVSKKKQAEAESEKSTASESSVASDSTPPTESVSAPASAPAASTVASEPVTMPTTSMLSPMPSVSMTEPSAESFSLPVEIEDDGPDPFNR